MTLYAAGSAYGAHPTSLGTATTDSSGHFSMSYTPPTPATVLYLVAVGGSVGSGNNSAMAMSGVLGLSNSAPASVTINELTTVAAEWALAQFTDSTGQLIGAPLTNSTGFINAVNQAQANLADIVAGAPAGFWTTYNANPVACVGASPPVNCDGLERMDTLANILASCTESSGPSSDACTTLLGDTGNGSTTLQAAHYIATNPTANLAALFALQTGSTSFAPALGAAPYDGWELALNLTPSGSEFSVPVGIAIDASGNIWITNFDGGSVTELTSSGALAGAFDPDGIFATPYGIAFDAAGDAWVTDPGVSGVVELTSSGHLAVDFDPTGEELESFSYPYGIAIDASGNIWVANYLGQSVAELTSGGELAGTFAPAGANFDRPYGIAIDASGNVWIADQLGSDVVELTSSGALAGNFDPDDAFDLPSGIALDASGNVWVPNFGGSVTELTSSGALAGNFDPDDAFDLPSGIAIDASGNAWVTDLGNAWVVELASSGNLAGIFAPAGANFSGPYGIAIDASGNVWTIDDDNNCVVEFIGAATPVLTPQVACLNQLRPSAVCLP